MNKYLTTGGIALAIVLAVAGLNRGSGNTIIGALTGPDIPFRYLKVGGVEVSYRSADLTAATTTPCSLDTPSATSTLLGYTAHVGRTKSDGATTFDIGVGSTAFATSSTLGTFVNAVAWGNAAQVDVATSSSALVIPPNSFIVFRLSTSTLSANWDGTGKCNAIFQTVR